VRTVYIGIDPGSSGGLAVILPPGVGSAVLAVPMPKTEADVWEWVSQHHGYDYDSHAMIEQVGGYVGGSGGNIGSAMFQFGQSYGGLRMALVAAAIPFEAVTPGNWQGMLKIPKKGKTESKTQWKNRLKARAQQLFPKVSVTLATADALLIALYCQRKHEGKL
jgi:hypothetical protein